MRNLTKLTLATTMLIAFSGADAMADNIAPIDPGNNIQSDAIVPGATPEKLMDEDASRHDTGFDLGTDIEPEAGTSPDVDTRSENDVMFGDIDTDKDGQITRIEFSNSIDADTSSESFSEFDENKDDMMSEAEYQAYLEADIKTDMSE